MKIKIKIILVLMNALLLGVVSGQAQESPVFEWAKSMGASGNDFGRVVKTDASGNVYTVGVFLNTVDFDPGESTFELTSEGDLDIFVSKLDAAGNFLWAKRIGGADIDYGQALTLDANGNVYVTGRFEGIVDFDPGTAIVNLSSSNADTYIVKLDAAGNFIWAVNIPGSGFDVGNAIATDDSGNVYVTGNFLATADFDPGPGTFNLNSNGLADAYVVKFDDLGNFIWAVAMGSDGNDNGLSIAVDASGNVYTTGYFQNTVDFDPGAGTHDLTSAGSFDVYISRLDASGNFVWAKRFGSTSDDRGEGIATDASGNIYTTGSFRLTVDFDPGTGTFSQVSAGGSDIFISKLDENGDFIWARRIGAASNDNGSGITTDDSGNPVITGQFIATVDFNPGTGTYNLTSVGFTDIYVAKLSSTGNFIWAVGMGGTTGDTGEFTTTTGDGNIYVTGLFRNTVDFDFGSGTHNLSAGTNGDIFILKIRTTPQLTNTFDTDDQGWTTTTAVGSPTPVYSSTGGNPGGMIQAPDLPAGASTPYSYFIAPAEYLGNKCSAYGKYLRFDLQQSDSRALLQPVADVIISNGTTTLYFFSLPAYPGVAPAWTSYEVTLNEVSGQWKTSNSSTGPAATKDQIKAVLCNLTLLQIRGRHGSAPSGTGSLDNVVIETLPLFPAPVITSFVPENGIPLETTVTIDGSGFGTTATDNIVYFGSTEAVVTSASPTQLTVTVPEGGNFGPLTVINLATGLQGQSLKPFNPIFKEGGRIIPSSLDPKTDILLDATAGNDLAGLTVADMDGDGWSDLVAAEEGINTISIFRNLGAGGDIATTSFASKFPLTGGGNGRGLRTPDLDGDGKLDIACGYSNGATTYFVTYRNTSTAGNLSFDAAEYWPGLVYSGPLSNAADVDGDGRIDLIGQHGNGSVNVDFWIAQNISTPGNIEFGSSKSYFGSSTLDAGAGVSVGDLDNDGKPEMIVKHTFGDQFQIIKNTSVPGTISFDTPFPIAEDSHGSITIADFNLDGKNDIAWKQGFSNDDVHIRLNTYTGGTLSADDFATAIILNSDLSNYGGMSVSDVNGDNKPDILISDASDIGVFENVYTGGTFDSNAFIEAYLHQGAGTSSYPNAPLATDLNGDHKPDLIVGITNSSPRRISIYENKNVHAPVISLTTVSPLKGPVGSTVTITGDYFSPIPAENAVHFGTISASVLTATPTQLTVRIPAGASYGPVSVTRNELTAQYHLPFDVVFAPGIPTFDASSFGAPVDFTLTSADFDLDVGDLNGDNKPDVIAEALGGFGAPRTYSFKNIHSGTTITTSSLIADDTTYTNARNAKLIDLNGDNKPDLVSQDGIARNVPIGTEINFYPLVATGNTSYMDFADFNLDGRIDISGVTGAVVQVYENRTRPGLFTTGTFASLSNSFNLTKPASNGSSAVADFDNDGFADIAATNPATDNITVWRNAGGYRISAAMFNAAPTITTLNNPDKIYDADLDADGKMDLVLYYGPDTESDQKKISIFHNQSTTGAISFIRQDLILPATSPSSEIVTNLCIGDLDGDGRPEIIMVSQAANSFRIWKNNTSPGVVDGTSFTVSGQIAITSPRAVATGDINQDGKADLIFIRTNFLTVMENLLAAAALTITTQPVPVTLCEGTSTNITLTATGDTNLQYKWQVYTGNLFVDLSNDETYSGTNANTLTITDADASMDGAMYRALVRGDFTNFSVSDTSVLTLIPAPAQPVITGASACSGTSVALAAAGGTNGQYRWYDAATGGVAIAGEVNDSYTTPVLTTTTSYFVAINDGTCESKRAEVVATINTLPMAPGATGASLCSPGTLDLIASGGTDGNYRWYDVDEGGTALAGEVNSNFTTPSLSASTTYYVAIHDGTCESNRTPVDAIINTPPAAPVVTSSITPGTDNTITICDETLILTAPEGYDSYLWSGGEQTQEITVTSPGQYSVQVTDGNGCSSASSDAIEVILDLSVCNSPPVILAETVSTKIEGSVTINLQDLISDPDDNLDLSTLRIVVQPSSGASASIDEDFNLVITYGNVKFSGTDRVIVEICDLAGSCTQEEITIEVIGDIKVYNAVSANGDDANPFLRLEYIEILEDTKDNHVTIFNRWGDAVFEISNYDNAGRVFKGLNNNGKELPSGTYYYQIDFAGKRKTQTGFLTLKR